MSRDAMDWARLADVGSVGRKAVLKELAYRAHGPDHSCEVSQRQLAEAIDQSERTVRRHLGDLESAGLLRREAQARPGRGRWIDRYVLHVDDPGRPANGDSRPANGDSRPATRGRGIGDPEISDPPLGPPRLVHRLDPRVEDAAEGVLAAANGLADHPLIADEQRRMRRLVPQWLQAGYSPEALATAIASAPTRTEPAITFELGKHRAGRSVGSDTVAVARKWIAAGDR